MVMPCSAFSRAHKHQQLLGVLLESLEVRRRLVRHQSKPGALLSPAQWRPAVVAHPTTHRACAHPARLSPRVVLRLERHCSRRCCFVYSRCQLQNELARSLGRLTPATGYKPETRSLSSLGARLTVRQDWRHPSSTPSTCTGSHRQIRPERPMMF